MTRDEYEKFVEVVERNGGRVVTYAKFPSDEQKMAAKREIDDFKPRTMRIRYFRELMIELDMALTGKDRRAAEHTAKQPAADIGSFLTTQREYYLSDGGYSRVVADFDGRIWPTSNSLARVKEEWEQPNVQRIVSALSKLIITEAGENHD